MAPDGSLFIADTYNKRIRKVAIPHRPSPVPLITSPDNGSQTRDRRPQIAGGGEPGATVTVTVIDQRGTLLGTTTVTQGFWTMRPSTDLPIATHTITATQQAPDHDPSPPTTPITFTITP
ncbi:Ig-like domain-containing protein [Spirillospora sp. NPDC049652]